MEACRGYSGAHHPAPAGARCDIKMRDCEIRLIPGHAPWSRNLTHDTTTTWPRTYNDNFLLNKDLSEILLTSLFSPTRFP